MRDSASPRVSPRACQLAGHHRLHGVVVEPEDGLADEGPDLFLLGVEQGQGGRRIGGLGRDPHLDPLHAAGQEGDGGIAPGGVSAAIRGARQLGQARLAVPPGAHHPAHDDRHVSLFGHPALQVGEDGAGEHLVHLVGDAGQGVDDLVAHRADETRGRPHDLDDGRGPLRERRPGGRCSRAWPVPASRTSERCFSTMAGSRTRGTFITSAMASRVMSSWVGPRPPHTTTPSLRARAVRRARTIRSWLSPTA